MIDQDGFRLNVGIILAHPTGSVLWVDAVKMRGSFLKVACSLARLLKILCIASFMKSSALPSIKCLF